MQNYGVKFVDELPDGHEWAMARDGERTVLFVQSDCVTPEVLEEAWAGFVMMQSGADVPEQRTSEMALWQESPPARLRRGLMFQRPAARFG